MERRFRDIWDICVKDTKTCALFMAAQAFLKVKYPYNEIRFQGRSFSKKEAQER